MIAPFLLGYQIWNWIKGAPINWEAVAAGAILAVLGGIGFGLALLWQKLLEKAECEGKAREAGESE